MMKYAFVFVFLFGASVDVRAQESPEKYSVIGIENGDTLNVRSRPDENSSIVTKLRNGYGGIIIGGEVVWNGGDDWVPILFSNTKGWVRPKYLAPNGQPIAGASVPHAIAVDADEDEDDDPQSPQPETASTAPRVSNNNDALWWGLAAILAGAIIKDEFFGGDGISQGESSTHSEYTPAEAEYDRQQNQRNENNIATSRGDPAPYPNVPH
jgi:hypothetical protein